MVYIYICMYVCMYICIYNGILLSYKNNEIMPFAATWMDPETIILSEVSQTEKDCLYVESKKKIQMNLFIKQKQTDIENKLMVTKGERRSKG